MPGFEGLARYQPALVLLLGLATFIGTWGTGSAALRALRLELPEPWREVAAALLGAGLLSLGVQVLAMPALATRPALLTLWAGVVGVGTTWLGLSARALGRRPRLALRGLGLPSLVLVGILLLAGALNVLLAMAPSTKIDEIFYQILPPARIALDGALVFYLRPWLASIAPQMSYPIAGAPLHALGFLDAPNVWSWCLGALLTWFAARLVHEQTGSAFAALLAAAGVQVGLYPSVYHTTGGPHALGDLATAGAVLALAFRRELLATTTATSYMALVSICAVLAASTKVSLLPLAVAAVALGFAQTLRSGQGAALRLAAAAVLPWLVLYLPLCLWTLAQSGSPFGPILAGTFGPSVFDASVHREMAASRAVNQKGLLFALRDYGIHYPLLYPVTLLALFALPTDAPRRRLVVGGLFVAQAVLVAVLLPHLPRFLSGLHHAALVVGLIQLHPLASRWLARPVAALAAAGVLLVPWLGLQAYRGAYLAPISLGLEERDDYYRSFIALYDDFLALDRLLPADAVILARNRLPLVYFPRPVFTHGRDLPAERPVFALLGTSGRPLEDYDCGYLRLSENCRLGEVVYANPSARYLVFRSPGRRPTTSLVEVRELLAR